jgi:hypothetical protein
MSYTHRNLTDVCIEFVSALCLRFCMSNASLDMFDGHISFKTLTDMKSGSLVINLLFNYAYF